MMENAGRLMGLSKSVDFSDARSDSSVDLNFVIFFLSLDIGQKLGGLSFDTAIMMAVLASVVTLSFFLTEPENGNSWVFGQAAIVVGALIGGVIFANLLGVLLPDSFGFLPFTLLLLSAVLCCFFQFYTFFRFRLSE